MKKENSKENRPPVYAKKVGNVRVCVWANGDEQRTFFNVTIGRTYRDGDQYKESSSLNGLGDVACLTEALRHVADWLSDSDDRDREGEDE